MYLYDDTYLYDDDEHGECEDAHVGGVGVHPADVGPTAADRPTWTMPSQLLTVIISHSAYSNDILTRTMCSNFICLTLFASICEVNYINFFIE